MPPDPIPNIAVCKGLARLGLTDWPTDGQRKKLTDGLIDGLTDRQTDGLTKWVLSPSHAGHLELTTFRVL